MIQLHDIANMRKKYYILVAKIRNFVEGYTQQYITIVPNSISVSII